MPDTSADTNTGNEDPSGKRHFHVTKRFVMTVLLVYFDTSMVHGYNIWISEGLRSSIMDWTKATGFASKESHWFGEEQCVRYLDMLLSAGAVIGCLMAPHAANHYGRKGGLLLTAFLGVFGGLFCGYSKYFESYVMLGLGVLIIGIKIGVSMILANMYISEITPLDIRANVASLYGSTLSFGHCCAFGIGKVLDNRQFWPLGFSVNIIPSIVLLMFLPLAPESPRYLFVKKNKLIEVRKGVKWLTGRGYTQKELNIASTEQHQYRHLGLLTVNGYMTSPTLRRALTICYVVIMGQQVCGFGTILTFLDQYMSEHDPHNKNHLRIGAQTFIFVIMIAVSLASSLVVDHVISMRSLFVASYFSLGAVCTAIVIVGTAGVPVRFEILVVLVLLYAVTYKIGIGTHPWYQPSMFFNTMNSATPYMLSYGINWIVRIFLQAYFTPLVKRLGSYVILNYSMTNFLIGYFVYKKFPAGKYRSVQELYMILERRNRD